MSKQKKSKPPFKAGDRVTTCFHPVSENVVRTVTSVIESCDFESEWAVSADGGISCNHCRRAFAQPTGYIDSHWFKLVSKAEVRE